MNKSLFLFFFLPVLGVANPDDDLIRAVSELNPNLFKSALENADVDAVDAISGNSVLQIALARFPDCLITGACYLDRIIEAEPDIYLEGIACAKIVKREDAEWTIDDDERQGLSKEEVDARVEKWQAAAQLREDEESIKAVVADRGFGKIVKEQYYTVRPKLEILEEMIVSLLEKGANVNYKNPKTGIVPLESAIIGFFCSISNHQDLTARIFKMLLEKGADPKLAAEPLDLIEEVRDLKLPNTANRLARLLKQ